MARITLSTNVRIGGKSIGYQITREEEGQDSQDPLLATLATAGQLTTRTSATAGVVTAANHAFVVNNAVCVFWLANTNNAPGVAREAVVSNTTSNTLTFASATGDALPVVNTNVTVAPINTVTMSLVASQVVMAAVYAQRRASVEFQTSANAAVWSLDLGKSGNDGEGMEWHNLGPVNTPFGSNVARVRLANGDSGKTCQVVIGALSNTLT